ncbi:hypothetical protein E3N88_35004 [Mikania micrantha]|uniref:JmjC domain-containing protein n=1 Tax=Mikania micrantha TaxID=192012 RepID=A0A5N6LZR6_9ASTR|nr:hypothetical protein E3N88_35004 [Mikania micrantha]
MLKLKDFPPNDKFEDILPHLCDEFIRALPYREYTDPNVGFFNLVVKLPPNYLMSDLGPVTYIAYGMAQELGRGDFVTNLHCDMSEVIFAISINFNECKCSGVKPWTLNNSWEMLLFLLDVHTK